MQEQEYLETLRGLWDAAWPAGVPRQAVYPWGEIPLTAYLRRWALEQPDKAAVVFYGADADLWRAGLAERPVCRGVAWRMGCVPGEAVCVFLQNCPQYLVVFYGILKAGRGACAGQPAYPRRLSWGIRSAIAGRGWWWRRIALMPIVREAMAEQRGRHRADDGAGGLLAGSIRRSRSRPVWGCRRSLARTRSIFGRRWRRCTPVDVAGGGYARGGGAELYQWDDGAAEGLHPYPG